MTRGWPSSEEITGLAFEASSRVELRREFMRRLARATGSAHALFADVTEAVEARHVHDLDPSVAEAARQTVLAHPEALRPANEQLFGTGVLVDTLVYTPDEWRRLPHIEQHQARMGIRSNLILAWQKPGHPPTILNLFASGRTFSEADERSARRHLRALALADAWHAPNSPGPALPELPELSDRQREILACVRRGLSNREIGKVCHLSPFTVRNHLVKLFELYGVSSRTELAMLGLDPEQ